MTKAPRSNPTDACKKRVQAIRKQLPRNVRTMIMEAHGEYNTGDGSVLIQNVLAGNTADLALTEILEKIAKKQKGGKK